MAVISRGSTATIYNQTIDFSSGSTSTNFAIDINALVEEQERRRHEAALYQLIEEARLAMLMRLELSFGMPLDFWEFDR